MFLALLLHAQHCALTLPPALTRRATLGVVAAAAMPGASVHAASENQEALSRYKNINTVASGGYSAGAAAEIQETVYAKLSNALTKQDWAAVTSLYLPEATVVDASGAGKPMFVRGSDAGQHFQSLAYETPRVALGASVFSCVLEDTAFKKSGTPKVVHAIYGLEATNVGRYQGSMRLIETADGWKIAEDVFPTNKPKAYAMLQPKRDSYGHVYLQLDSRYLFAQS